MSGAFAPSLLDALDNVLVQRTGLLFGADRHADLERGVRAAARDLGFSNANACAQWLASSVASNYQIRILASRLTVGETYFFREKASFEFLEKRFLPDLIAERCECNRRLRIWSAGCCTGEEPYSIAMLLARMLPDPARWQTHILGTDINEHFLEKAKEATYGDWSFRESAPAAVKGSFERMQDGRYRLTSDVRNHVSFAPLNLIDDVYPSPANGTNELDLILCRNVLIYMEPAQARKIVRNLSRCLADGGWLLVGAAEGSQIADDDLEPADVPGVMAFRKARGGHRPRARRSHILAHVPAVPIAAASITSVAKASRIEKSQPAARPSASDLLHQKLALAEVAFAAGRYADVIAVLQPLCAAGNGPAQVVALLARSHANQGRQAEALAWCEKAINTEKLNSRLYYLKASIHQERGDINEAGADFRRAIYLDPDFVMAHVSAGHVAVRLGRQRESKRHLETARRLLEHYPPDQAVPEAEGIDARQLFRLIAREACDGGSNG